MSSLSKRVMWSIATLITASLACQALSTTAPEPTPAQEPTTAPAPTATTTENEILYEDDFDDPNSGFLSLRDAEGITDYDQGGYRIKVDKADWFFWVESGRTFTDVQIDADAKKIGGPDDNEYGLICRYQDENNFYFFTITSDGYYGLSRQLNDEIELIGMRDFKSSSAINQGDAENHLTVVCDGNSLRFSVNDTLLAELKDDSFASGDVGFIVGTGELSGVDILFDNLVVTSP